jgi:DNA-binding response OmpR family regulator
MSKLILVLVAEDDVMVRNVLVKILSNREYQVLEAESALAAAQLSDTFEGTIHLLIANESLGPRRAHEIFEGLWRSRPSLKVLQISGFSLQIIERAGAVIPGAEFLQKPFLPKLLLEKVRQVLGLAGIAQAARDGIL